MSAFAAAFEAEDRPTSEAFASSPISIVAFVLSAWRMQECMLCIDVVHLCTCIRTPSEERSNDFLPEILAFGFQSLEFGKRLPLASIHQGTMYSFGVRANSRLTFPEY